MQATFLDEKGKPQLLQMGCYGIGITRIAGAAIEQNHDERGMIWPAPIAPFAVVICPIGYDRSPAVREAADALHRQLLEAPASMPSSTIAASVPARCSPTGS